MYKSLTQLYRMSLAFSLLTTLCLGIQPCVAQICNLGSTSYSDTLVIQLSLGTCDITEQGVLASMTISNCSNADLLPNGPYSIGTERTIDLVDRSDNNNVVKTFTLQVSPIDLSVYSAVLTTLSTGSFVQIPLAAGECTADKDLLLNQLGAVNDPIIRSDIHFLQGNSRVINFFIGDTIDIDRIQCAGLTYATDVKLLFQPDFATVQGDDSRLLFDVGLSSCPVTISQVLSRVGYSMNQCDIDRLHISQSGPYGYGRHMLQKITIDSFMIISDAYVNVGVGTSCPTSALAFGSLPQGKCALNEADIIERLGLSDTCNTVIEIYPRGPYMSSPLRVTHITIGGAVVCASGFDVTFDRSVGFAEETALFCNSEINISLDQDCLVKIDADNILEGGPYCFLNYNISAALVSDPDQILLSGHMITFTTPGIYRVSITNPETNNSCWSIISIEDKFIEEIICLPDTIMCYNNNDTRPDTVSGFGPDFPFIGPDAIYIQGAEVGLYDIQTGNDCGINKARYTDTVIAECADGYKKIIRRDWRFYDAAGNLATCSQIIHVRSVDIGQVIPFQSYRGNCLSDYPQLTDQGFPLPEVTGFPAIDNIHGADVCGNLKLAYTDTPFPLCGKSVKIVRNWVILDWCTDRVVDINQIIIIEDTLPPQFLDTLPDLDLDSDPFLCGREVIQLPEPDYSDCGSDEVTLEILYETYDIDDQLVLISNGNSLILPVIRMVSTVSTFDVIYILTDECGNINRDTIAITISDTESPVAVCDKFTVISIAGQGEALVRALTFDDLSVDNCGIASYQARKINGDCHIDPIFKDRILFCCEEVGDTIHVEFKVTDLAGNSNICLVFVYVQDKFRPHITCPPDIRIDCGEDINDLNLTGAATAIDNCGIDTLGYSDNIELSGCGNGRVIRTWMAADRTGDFVTCTQVITIQESQPFALSDANIPNDTTVIGCTAALDPDVLGRPDLSYSGCANVDASHEDLPFYNVESACVKIIREWTIIDWCQYSNDPSTGIWRQPQVIKLISDIGPIFMNDDLANQYCIAEDDCNGRIDITAIAEDADLCTPTSDLQWTYRLYERDNYSQILASGLSDQLNEVLAVGLYSILFSAEDGCNNITLDTFHFEVIDCAPPTLDCTVDDVNLVLDALGMATLEMSSISINVADNCTNAQDLVYSFDADSVVTSLGFSCDDLEGGVSYQGPLPIYVSDARGNQSSCELILEISDNSANVCPDDIPPVDSMMVAGRITTEQGDPMTGVQVSLYASGIKVREGISDDSGHYDLGPMPEDKTYTVRMYKDGDPFNGLTTRDLVLIRRHILGLYNLGSPYNIIASDIDDNGKIRASDLVYMRRLIIGKDVAFPNGQEVWRFVDASHIFDEADNPFPYPEEIILSRENQGEMDFVAVKIGDVDNSRILKRLSAKGRSESSKIIDIDLAAMEEIAGAYFVPVRGPRDLDILGLQLSFTLSDTDVDKIGLLPGSLPIDESYYFHNPNTDELTVSWHVSGADPRTVGEEPLFYMITDDLQLAHNLARIDMIEDKVSEWILPDLSTVAVAIRFSQLTAKVESDLSLAIEGNRPNPFTYETNLVFNMKEEGEVFLEVIDESGRIVMTKHFISPAGQNQFRLSAAALSHGEGVYWVRLSTRHDIATHKVLLIR